MVSNLVCKGGPLGDCATRTITRGRVGGLSLWLGKMLILLTILVHIVPLVSGTKTSDHTESKKSVVAENNFQEENSDMDGRNEWTTTRRLMDRRHISFRRKERFLGTGTRAPTPEPTCNRRKDVILTGDSNVFLPIDDSDGFLDCLAFPLSPGQLNNYLFLQEAAHWSCDPCVPDGRDILLDFRRPIFPVDAATQNALSVLLDTSSFKDPSTAITTISTGDTLPDLSLYKTVIMWTPNILSSETCAYITVFRDFILNNGRLIIVGEGNFYKNNASTQLHNFLQGIGSSVRIDTSKSQNPSPGLQDGNKLQPTTFTNVPNAPDQPFCDGVGSRLTFAAPATADQETVALYPNNDALIIADNVEDSVTACTL